MIQVHFAEILSSYYDSSTLLYQVSDIFGSLPAPLFTFLVGMSLFISVKRQEEAGVEPQALADRNLRRGGAIFFFGLAFAALIWTPAEVFGWDILTLIGASLLIVFPLRNLGNKLLISLAVLIIAVSPLFRIWSDYYRYWNHWGEYVPAADLKGVLLGFTLNGYFPLLPWLVFPICGYLIGRACFGKEQATLPRFLAPTGAALVVISLLFAFLAAQFPSLNGAALAGLVAPLTFYPASATYVGLTLGIIFILFALFFRLFDQKTEKVQDGKLLMFFRRYSRYALTAYIVHHAVLVWPLLAAASYAGKRDHWFYYGEVMPTLYSLLLSFLFVALFYVVIIFWEKRDGHYSFEWLLKRLTG